MATSTSSTTTSSSFAGRVGVGGLLGGAGGGSSLFSIFGGTHPNNNNTTGANSSSTNSNSSLSSDSPPFSPRGSSSSSLINNSASANLSPGPGGSGGINTTTTSVAAGGSSSFLTNNINMPNNQQQQQQTYRFITSSPSTTTASTSHNNNNNGTTINATGNTTTQSSSTMITNTNSISFNHTNNVSVDARSTSNNSPSSSASSSGASAGMISSTDSLSNAIPKFTFQYGSEKLEIRNVWAENVEEEMAIIRELIETHPYVAMDTEFPGIVARPVSESFSPDFHYKSLKVNVDLLKIIQLGLSFADSNGNFAHGCPCWQFNFKFNLQDDMFAQDSIDLLANAGISFEDHATHGIEPLKFGELLMVSGLVLDDRVKWVSFHAGYDYGYLLKLLTTLDLPNDEKTFFETLKLYFPTIYDIKYMTSLVDGHFGGLQKLADVLGCQRVGVEHQAGSDSLLTMTTYFALMKAKFGGIHTTGENVMDDSRYKNELYGYGNNHTARKNAAHALLHHTNSSMTLTSFNGGGE